MQVSPKQPNMAQGEFASESYSAPDPEPSPSPMDILEATGRQSLTLDPPSSRGLVLVPPQSSPTPPGIDEAFG